MAAEWFYQAKGQQWGPVASSELRRLADAGAIMPDTPVCRATATGMPDGRWARAEKVQGLFEPSGSEGAPTVTACDPEPISGPEGESVAAGSQPTPPSPPLPMAEATSTSAPRSISRRLNRQFQCMKKGLQRLNGQLQRFTPALLMVTIGLLVVSVILQGIMCMAVVAVQKQMSNSRNGVPVNVRNYEVPVKVRNHYIISADPIPVEVTNREVPVNVRNYELDVNVTNREVPVKVRNR